MHLIIPAIDAEVTTVGHGVLQLGTPDGTTIGRKLATEVWVIILTCVIKGSDVAVAPAPLAVGLGVVCVQIVAS